MELSVENITSLLEDAYARYGAPLTVDHDYDRYIIELHDYADRSGHGPWVSISDPGYAEPEVIDFLDNEESLVIAVDGQRSSRQDVSDLFFEANVREWATMLANKASIRLAPSLAYSHETGRWSLEASSVAARRTVYERAHA